MNRKLDLKGHKYNSLKVFSKVNNPKSKRPTWFCFCDCGALTEVRSTSLQIGGTKSCGCLSTEVKTTHGMSRTRLASIFNSMKYRCYNKKHKSFHHYGGSGVTICKKWLDDPGKFFGWAKSNRYSDDLWIDRKDNNKGYSPSNCRWVTPLESASNRRLITKANKTGFCGVVIRNRLKTKRFYASVRYKGKSYDVGYHDTAKEAARARDNLVIQNGWPHPLNFEGNLQ